MKATILAVLCCAANCLALTQESSVILQGKILHMNLTDSSEAGLADIPVEIWSDDSLLATIFSQDKGKYKFSLPFFHHYMIKYGGGDHIVKMVEVDASDFAQQTRMRGYILDVDIILFDSGLVDGLEFLEQEPIAKALYSKAENTVVWEAERTEEMNARINDKIQYSR